MSSPAKSVRRAAKKAAPPKAKPTAKPKVVATVSKLPTKRARAARLSPTARKAQLVDCAIRVFAREGISHANHTQLANEAGVSLAAVFAYFPTHDDLRDAVLAYVSRFMLERLIQPRQTGSESAQYEIEDTLIGFANLIESHRDITRVWLDWSTAVRGESWPAYLVHHGKVLEMFEATIRRGKASGEVEAGIHPSDAAWVLIGVGHMIAHMKFAGLSKTRIVRAVSSVVRSYFRGRAHVALAAPRGRAASR